MRESRLGFVGLGAMGAPMTRHLAAAGHRLRVFDSDAKTLEELSGHANVERAPSLAAVAAGVEVLFTCLPNDAVVRAVYLGGDGIGSAGPEGLITVDCSTVSPGVTQEVSEALGSQAIRHLDASMLGSVAQAESGSIGFVVGGDAEAFEVVRPYLDVLGKMVRHVGPSGAANRMKLIHQTLVAGYAVAVAEAMALCVMTGTDIETFYDIVCEGGGFAHSRYFENRVPRMRAGEFSPLFMLQFMLKDARLAAELIENAAESLPLLASVIETLDKGEKAGWGKEDFSAVVHVLEERTGTSMVKGKS